MAAPAAAPAASPLSLAPIACEEAHFGRGYRLIAAEFPVVVRPAGSVAAIVAVAVALDAAVEAFADCLGTEPTRNPPIPRMDPLVVRKSLPKERTGKVREALA